MINFKSLNKNFLWEYISYFILFIYLIYAILFAFERILNIDNSFFLFEIINRGTFILPEKRYGNWLSQLPVLIFLKLKFNLETLIYVFSISFPLLYLFIIWLCHAVFDNKPAALAAILSLITGVGFSFFHPVTETHQALAYSALLYAIINFKGFTNTAWKYYLISVIGYAWCLLTHPAAVFTCLFVLLISVIKRENKKRHFILFLIILTLLAAAARFFFSDETSYDNQQYSKLLGYENTLFKFFELYAIKYFIIKWKTIYLAPIILIFSVFVYGIINKKFTELVIAFICFLVFFIISILTFYTGESDAMMEKSFMPGIFMPVFIFSIFFYEDGKAKSLTRYSLLACLVISFIEIAVVSFQFSDRLNYLEKISKYQTSHNKPKLIANFSDFNESVLQPNSWATGIDMLMLSLTKHTASNTLFLTNDKYNFNFDKNDTTLFLCVSWAPYWNVKKLNRKYFKLSDQTYQTYKQ